MTLNQNIVGQHYRVEDYYEVGREKIREYATAVQDPHPAHHDEGVAKGLGYDGLIAPLTFISIVGLIAQRRLFEDGDLGLDLSRVMQTDQRLVFHKPIQAGDRLICDVYVDSIRSMGGSEIIVTKNIVTDQNGELVQTTYTTLVGRNDIQIDGVG